MTDKLFYSRRECAALLGISSRSLDYLIQDGRLGSTKLGGRRLIGRDQLEAFAGVAIRQNMAALS